MNPNPPPTPDPDRPLLDATPALRQIDDLRAKIARIDTTRDRLARTPAAEQPNTPAMRVARRVAFRETFAGGRAYNGDHSYR